MLKQLETFIVVYQTRHFTHAAQQLFISQPTVSVHISQLEAELNTQLFTRNGRQQLTPTPRADLLYAQAQRVLAEWRQTQKLFAKPHQLTFRIGTSHTTARTLLPALLAAHPELLSDDIQLTINMLNSEEILQQVAEHQLDFGLIAKPITNERVTRTTLYEDPIVRAGNLTSDLWLVREAGSGLRHYTDQYLKQLEHPVKTLEIGNNTLIIALLEQGIGQSFISKSLLPTGMSYEMLPVEFNRYFYALTPEHQTHELAQLTQTLINTAKTLAN